MSPYKKFSYHKDGRFYEVLVTLNKSAFFFCNGLRHRENGPASVYVYYVPNYYLSNVRISKEEHARRTNK